MNKRSAVVLSRICALALVLFMSIGLFAQVQNGVFTGTVTDPSGAAVPGAAVTIANIDTGFTTNTTTNSTGQYTSQALPVGNYKLTIAADKFKTAEKANQHLDVGSTARLDFKLVIGTKGEVVEVTEEAALVNTTDSKLSANVSSTQIASLPLNGRNVYDLIQLAPGAVNVRGVMTENGANTVVNGLRENFNGFLLNGVSNKGLSGGAMSQPIQDSVQEFQLLTLNMSAQYGNSAGAITNLVTKGGTNAFHGSAFGFLRNQNLDATDFFTNHTGDKKPGLNFKQYGATIGGPIVKDKLFFYGAWQSDRFLTSTTPSPITVESPEFRAAAIAANPNSVAALLYSNFTPANSNTTAYTLNSYLAGGVSDAGLATPLDYMCNNNVDNGGTTVAQRFGNIFGVTAATNTALTGMGCSALALTPGTFLDANAPFMVNALNLSPTQLKGNLFDGNEYSGRIDWNASQNDRVFGQFNWTKNGDKFAGGPTGLRGFTSPTSNTIPNFQFSYTHVFTPTVVNEFKAGYSGSYATITTGQGGVPAVGFDDGSLGFGSYNGYPQTFHENIYTYSDLVSITKGKHSMKVGFEFRRNIENSEFNVARPSYYFFDPLFFAVDAPYTEAAGVNPNFNSTGSSPNLESNVRHWRNKEIGAYFQDDWKVTSRFTLNLGIRYDLYARHNELDNKATTFILGPGSDIITGMRSANILAGQPGCDTPLQMAQAVLAGVCGTGGFAPASSLGKGDHNNFGPRLGFAWDVRGDGKTSLRGGVGVSYEGTLYNPLSNSRWNPPYYSFNSITNYLVGDTSPIFYGPQSGGAPSFTGSPDPLNNQGTRGAQAIGNINGWSSADPNFALLTGIVPPQGLRDPYVFNTFLSIQHEILPKTILQVDYVGTFGHKLFRASNINASAGGRLPGGICITTQDSLARVVCSNNINGNTSGRINGNYGTMREWQNVVNSNYHGLQVSMKKAMSHGLSANLNYTWSHTIDGGSTWHSGATSSNGAAGGEGFLTDQALPNVDRSNAIFDVRHRFVLNYVWDLPSFRGSNAFVRAILGDWSYNGIVSYQSGAKMSPFDNRPRKLTALVPGGCSAATLVVDQSGCVNTGGDYNLDRVTNDRPNSTITNYSPTTAQWADGWGPQFALNNGIFSTPCLGCIGNLGRNTFVGPHFIGADMSLFKNIPVTEKVKLQFRWEVFNIFNHTNFELPGAESAPHGRVNNGAFGQAGGTFNPRQMQFGLKLNF